MKNRLLLGRHDAVTLFMARPARLHFFLAIPGVVTGRAFRETQVGMLLVMKGDYTCLAAEGDRLLVLWYGSRVSGACKSNEQQGDDGVSIIHPVYLTAFHVSSGKPAVSGNPDDVVMF